MSDRTNVPKHAIATRLKRRTSSIVVAELLGTASGLRDGHNLGASAKVLEDAAEFVQAQERKLVQARRDIRQWSRAAASLYQKWEGGGL